MFISDGKGSGQRAFCIVGAVDESVINFPPPQFPAAPWICELKIPKTRKYFHFEAISVHLRLNALRCCTCYDVGRKNLLQTVWNLCNIIDIGARLPTEKGRNTDGFNMKYASLLVESNSGERGERNLQRFFGLIYFSGLWPQTHN